MAFKPFERSKKDVEPKGMKEGSRKEEAFDKFQAKGKPTGKVTVKAAKIAPPFAKGAVPFKKGGKVGC